MWVVYRTGGNSQKYAKSKWAYLDNMKTNLITNYCPFNTSSLAANAIYRAHPEKKIMEGPPLFMFKILIECQHPIELTHPIYMYE